MQTFPFPPTPPPLLSRFLSLPSTHSAHRGKSKPFVFCVQPVHSSSPPPFFSFSPPLTKSLFRLDTAENHMVCDIIRAGSREKGMIELGRDWLARSLCSDISRKALLEARWGVKAEQVGIYSFLFFKDFTPTWIIRG